MLVQYQLHPVVGDLALAATGRQGHQLIVFYGRYILTEQGFQIGDDLIGQQTDKGQCQYDFVGVSDLLDSRVAVICLFPTLHDLVGTASGLFR